MIKVIYNKVCGRCVQSEPLTSGMVGQPIHFEYSHDFDGLTLTAVFTNGKTTVDVLNPGNQCVIPHEVLDTVGALVNVGIYATKGNELVIPTVYATIGVVQKGADPSGDVSADPTLPVWAQIQGIIGDPSELTTEAKNNLVAAINEAAQSGGGGGSSIALDTTLTQSGKAADAAAVGNRLNALSEEIGGGLSETAKTLLVTILRNGVYGTDQSNNISALATELGVTEEEKPDTPAVTLSSISAIYTGGDVAVGTAVTDLTGIVVTAHYSDGTSATVTGYTMSGTIAEGENTITVIYQGKSATFTVNGIAESTGENNGWTDGDPYTDMVTWQDGYTINATTGVAEADTAYSITDYLPCKGVDAFSSTNGNSYTIYLYDDNKNYIGKSNLFKTGVYASSYLTSDGQTPAYFRTMYRTTWKDQGQWQPFITPHKLPVATPTTVIEAGNYYIPVFKAGYTVWNNTGVEVEDKAHYCTDFIFIKDFASISISTRDTANRKWIGFYDAEKNYINGEAGNSVTRVVPENAYYCRIDGENFPGIRWWIMPNAGEGV